MNPSPRFSPSLNRRTLLRSLGLGAAAMSLGAWKVNGAQAPRPSAPAADGPPVRGEEWRAMDKGAPAYDPTASADILRDARRGIREHRMRDVELRLVDRNGRARAGQVVEVVQLRHDFPFGDMVWELDAMARDGQWDTERARAWRQRFSGVFNAATNLAYWTERPSLDASKTEDRQGEPHVENFARTVEWVRGEGMFAKGHPLFWSIPKCIPEWVRRYDHATFMKFAEVRVRDLVARFRGKMRLWDAVNEPMWEAAPRNLDRRKWPHIEPIESIVEYVEPVLRWCREEDPDATFLINDYGMEVDYPKEMHGSDGSIVTAASQRKRYLALMRALQDRGMAPDAIGLQSHTGWIGHEQQRRVYDEMATAGLPLHVTEFWARTKDLQNSGRYSAAEVDQLQAEYVANTLTCAFGHPALEGFFFWGFMNDAIVWRDERSSHELKPLYTRVQKLLREEWTTRERLTTTSDGVVRFRGFYGDYSARLIYPNGLPHGNRFRVARGATGTQTLIG